MAIQINGHHVSEYEIAAHVILVAFFLVVGVTGNAFVIYIYSKEKKQTGRVYILALAWMDLIGCVCMLPQVAALNYGLVNGFIFGVEGLIQAYSYSLVNLAMALDRVFAVFLPFKHIAARNKANKCLLVVFCIATTLSSALIVIAYLNGMTPFLFQFILLTYVSINSVILLFLAAAYPAIAIKLYKQKKKMDRKTQRNKITGVKFINRVVPMKVHGSQGEENIQSTSAQRGDVATTSQQETAVVQQRKATAVHIKTLKLYGAILALFLFTFSAGTTLITLESAWPGYLYYVSNIGNPLVYYVFIEKFRNSAKFYCRKLFKRN